MKRKEAEELLKKYKSWNDDQYHDYLSESDGLFLDVFFNNSASTESRSVMGNEQTQEVCSACNGLGYIYKENGSVRCNKCNFQ